jgi:hypothetical protein
MPKVKPEISDWFDCPDDPYKGRVQVRLVPSGESDLIKERTREMVFTHGQPAIRMPDSKLEHTIAAVKQWENFFDADDKPLKCTPANVKLICENVDGFIDFIDECLVELEKRAQAKMEAEVKN